jgi:putative hemolysin
MAIALLLGLILLNGAFAMSEIALVTARRARLERMVEGGDSSAASALELGAHPTRFLSTIQIGITSIGILNGIVGEAVLAAPFARWLQSFGLAQQTSEISATALVVVAITYFSIVLGELVPKRLGQLNPEPIARIVARPMLWLAFLTKPFERVLSGSTELLIRLLGVRQREASAVTEEDIEALLAEGSDAGVIERSEHDMVRNVFRLDDRLINSLMVPRSAIVYLDTTEPNDETLRKLRPARHSRFPVCRGGINHVLGIANARGLLSQVLGGGRVDIESGLDQALYVPETLTGMELLTNFKATDTHFALVVDEYGEVQGAVTLQDILEAITGEFTPHRAEEAWAVRREDGSWLLDGLIPLPELKDRLGLRALPDEERGRYNTLSGMLMQLLGRLPHVGDKANWDRWAFEIVDMDNKRIDQVLATEIFPSSDGSSLND